MNSLAEEIIAGRRLGSREEALPLVEAELEALCRGADRIRSALCGSRADLCTIVNGRSGQCEECYKLLEYPSRIPYVSYESALTLPE